MKESVKGARIKSLFSRNLRRLRIMKSLSQANLAAEADLATNFVNDIESGKKWVSAETLGKLAMALNVEPYQFFISESMLDDKGVEIISHYVGDLRDSFTKLTDDYLRRISPESAGAKKPDGHSG